MSAPADRIPALIRQAVAAADRAYVPYSGYPVGAALLSADGAVFTGCNVENASYPAGICAERTALVKAVSEGARQFDLLVVATANGGTPCGICRQMLSEFAPALRIVTVDFDGQVQHDLTLAELLPYSFGAADMAPDDPAPGTA